MLSILRSTPSISSASAGFMKSSAIVHAQEKLTRAAKALDELKRATGYAEAEAAWTDLLIASSTIYSKLEQGAKGCGRSEAWYGGVKGARRKDDLLRYLHYARNSEEHGIERTSVRLPNNISLEGKRLRFNEVQPVSYEIYARDRGELLESSDSGVMLGPGIKLIRAHDRRFNDFCDPPQSHLGKRIKYPSPILVGELALAYQDAIVSAAAKLPEH